nr:hypothetical protein [Tanacetum cinerariifolium]
PLWATSRDHVVDRVVGHVPGVGRFRHGWCVAVVRPNVSGGCGSTAVSVGRQADFPVAGAE